MNIAEFEKHTEEPLTQADKYDYLTIAADDAIGEIESILFELSKFDDDLLTGDMQQFLTEAMNSLNKASDALTELSIDAEAMYDKALNEAQNDDE